MALTEEGILHVPGMLSRWVRLASGAKAHYLTSGETGPAVVLLHGGLQGSSGQAGWRLMAPFLGANGFRVFCPDQPGFGLADTREEYRPTGNESYVEFIHEFVNAMCLDRFHLGGNSMGCSHSALYACAHPERLLSLALIAGDIGDVLPGDRPRTPPPAFDGSPESMRKMLDAIVHHGAEMLTDELIEMRTLAANRQRESYTVFAASNAAGHGRIANQSDNVRAQHTTKGRLDKLTIPAIHLYGMEDALTPVTWAYEQEKVVPNIQYFFPEDCGHQGQTDQPDMFNQVFLEFFRDGVVSRKAADWAGVSRHRPELPVVASA